MRRQLFLTMLLLGTGSFVQKSRSLEISLKELTFKCLQNYFILFSLQVISCALCPSSVRVSGLCFALNLKSHALVDLQEIVVVNIKSTGRPYISISI